MELSQANINLRVVKFMTESKQTPKIDFRKSLTPNNFIDWGMRLLKGVLIGIGAILPGMSGGVLAVVFGIYEPLVRFLANIRHKFLQNVYYFIPIGIGGILGVVAFSAVVEFAFDRYPAQFIWLFVGFIVGTFPSLLKTAAKKGRKPWHWLVLAIFAVGTLAFMRWGESISTTVSSYSLFTWLLSGMIMGLGLIVPGMSPSNFLIYLGLYQPMASGIRQLDLGVIIPLALGVIICVAIFAKLINWLFNKAYTFMYHFILGVVVGSTIAIIPSGVSGWTILVCAILFVVGAIASYALAKVDEKHPHESIF
jgi:putative membrane protein